MASYDPAQYAAAAAAAAVPVAAPYGQPAYGQPAAAYGQPPAGYGQPPAVYPAAAYAPAAYAPAPASYPYHAPYGAPPPSSDEPRTVFISGFPVDVKERELHNLLRFLPGYEAAQMHTKAGQAQGFALFENGAAAQHALRLLSSLAFDDRSVLRCEMARKNMFINDASGKRGRFDGHYAATAPYFPGAVPAAAGQPYSGGSSSRADNPPCNTLFIGGLGEGAAEAELQQLFGSSPGFQQIKLNRGPRGVTCFVEFTDVASAMAVHQAKQGAVLVSSGRGGIRIEFSKNPLGRKRDYGAFGAPAGTAQAGGGAHGGQTLGAPGAAPVAGGMPQDAGLGAQGGPAGEAVPGPMAAAALSEGPAPGVVDINVAPGAEPAVALPAASAVPVNGAL